jgi:hypothetical protein
MGLFRPVAGQLYFLRVVHLTKTRDEHKFMLAELKGMGCRRMCGQMCHSSQGYFGIHMSGTEVLSFYHQHQVN